MPSKTLVINDQITRNQSPIHSGTLRFPVRSPWFSIVRFDNGPSELEDISFFRVLSGWSVFSMARTISSL